MLFFNFANVICHSNMILMMMKQSYSVFMAIIPYPLWVLSLYKHCGNHCYSIWSALLFGLYFILNLYIKSSSITFTLLWNYWSGTVNYWKDQKLKHGSHVVEYTFKIGVSDYAEHGYIILDNNRYKFILLRNNCFIITYNSITT